MVLVTPALGKLTQRYGFARRRQVAGEKTDYDKLPSIILI